MLTAQSWLACLVAVTTGLILALALRKPLRRFFGATVTMHLWWLPLLLALMPLLPALPIQTLPIRLMPLVVDGKATRADFHGLGWVLVIWLLGCTGSLGRLLWQGLRLHLTMQPLPASMRAGLRDQYENREMRHWWLHRHGPATLFSWPNRLLLPADFMWRFDQAERHLVLRHELTHLKRRDPLWSLLAEITFALLWFHPLAWLAMPRFRLDQELACDETVLRELPHAHARYAQTLLHSNGVDTMPALPSWLTEPQLKERLNMIKHPSQSLLRRRLGLPLSIVVLAGSGLATHAATHADGDLSASIDVPTQSGNPPHYPADAIQKKQQGLVVLRIHVDKYGHASAIQLDPSTPASVAPSLQQAAIAAASKWKFNPPVEQGKPVDGYARVPVQFAIDPDRQSTDKSSSNI